MSAMNSPHIEQFRESLGSWTDQRFISREEIEVAAMFVKYLVNLADEDGWSYDGHSWKESEYLGCLVVKATVDDIPVVCFTSSKTTMGGMKVFLRKLEAGVLEWVPDKFRR